MAQPEIRAEIERARTHLARGEPLRALRVLDQTSWADLHWPEYWQLRAEAFLSLGEFRHAASSAREGLTDTPDHLPLLQLYTQALLELKQWDRAQETLAQALELYPHDSRLQELAQQLKEGLKAGPEATPIPRKSPRRPDPARPAPPEGWLVPLVLLLLAAGVTVFWLWRYLYS
ncbi:hypothetical protein DV704_09090 [Meiothermus sp. QL-1]|uniref:tetratricopeptide repeat protein n=1 Tax=Meiothermus sp. QL-1 TaxID=2058095 RepID=UPI000E0A4577|nr:tetratricopeptide repeat protein [Meiothermus sp. QL-1]RDI95006.1 hypothetical protein DV704_09090 [Meiothermus sp. QL-1]